MPTLIRCTARLRKEMGLRETDLSQSETNAPLGDWYAHLFFQDRKKCVLFAAEKSLLTFLVPAVSREQIRSLAILFRDGLFRLLLDEGFQPKEAEPVLAACTSVEYAATSDRSMTGSVNELVKDAQFWMGKLGGAANPNTAAINRRLNSAPMKRIGFANAIEATRKVLGGGVRELSKALTERSRS